MKTIRLIHNLPRSGGTIISKCLGAQKDIILLSEIHPEGIAVSKKMGVNVPIFDPIYQFQRWNNLFKESEYKEMLNSNLKFEEKIELIYEKTDLSNKKLIIRDWAFVDFFGRPFVEPSYKNSLFEILSKKYKVLNFYLIRHPLKLFTSCYNNLGFFRRDYDFEFFLKGYRNYYLNASKGNICVFENFIEKPEKKLKNMCDVFKIDYDNNYFERLKDVNLTGDKIAIKSLEIHNKDSLSTRKLLKDNDLNKIENRPDFLELMEDLKDHYQNV